MLRRQLIRLFMFSILWASIGMAEQGYALHATFFIHYDPPIGKDATWAWILVKEKHWLEEILITLEEKIKLPKPLFIHMVSNDGPFFNPQRNEIRIPYDYLVWYAHRLKQITPDISEDDVEEQVVHHLSWMLYNHVAQAVIYLLRLPVVNMVEATDAMVLLLASHGMENEVLHAISDTLIYDLKNYDQEVAREMEPWENYYIEPYRYVRLLCWIHGYNPKHYQEVIQKLGFRAEQFAHCPMEYHHLIDYWNPLLEPYWIQPHIHDKGYAH